MCGTDPPSPVIVAAKSDTSGVAPICIEQEINTSNGVISIQHLHKDKECDPHTLWTGVKTVTPGITDIDRSRNLGKRTAVSTVRLAQTPILNS